MSDTTYTLPSGAADWLRHGERGISSEAIFSHLTKLPIGGGKWGPQVPLNPDDLRRCRLLLSAVPAFRARLSEMAELGPMWAALVEHWDELCALMDVEAPGMSGSAPQTFQRMADLLDDARAGRPTR